MEKLLPTMIVILAGSASCSPPSPMQSNNPASSGHAGKIDMARILGKQLSEVEAVLGKPIKSSTSPLGLEIREYDVPDAKRFEVCYAARGGGLPKTLCSAVYASFDKAVTWQVAAQALGMNVGDLKPTNTYDGESGQTQLVGDPFKGWNVWFSGFNAKWSNGKLINNDHGLPQIWFEQRSINDKTPD